MRSGFSRVPVVGENKDNIVSIAYLKDIVAWSRDHPGANATKKIATVMRRANFVPDGRTVDELLRQMQAQRDHMVIVIDGYRRHGRPGHDRGHPRGDRRRGDRRVQQTSGRGRAAR